jgi:NAD(P)-dependent dehydrogenase (short-subunit alcohol dehydrogenase family)
MRHVVITGAGGGLGRVCADNFGKAGDRVYACDISVSAIATLKALSWVADARVVDVADATQVDQFFDSVLNMASCVDVLINNVGVAGPVASVEQISRTQWAATLDANLNGAFWAIQRVLPAMKTAKKGVILNVSTCSVRTIPECRAPYVVAKAGLEALTRVVAREAGPFNVRCNAIRPGAMDNDRLALVIRNLADRTNRSTEEVEHELLKYASMRSKVSMGEVAALLQFLASDAAAHITSQIVEVDAGTQWEE